LHFTESFFDLPGGDKDRDHQFEKELVKDV